MFAVHHHQLSCKTRRNVKWCNRLDYTTHIFCNFTQNYTPNKKNTTCSLTTHSESDGIIMHCTVHGFGNYLLFCSRYYHWHRKGCCLKNIIYLFGVSPGVPTGCRRRRQALSLERRPFPSHICPSLSYGIDEALSLRERTPSSPIEASGQRGSLSNGEDLKW